MSISKHPQRAPFRGYRIGRALALLLAVLLLGGCGKKETTFLGSGTMEARELTLSAKAQGQLMSLKVEEGQQVKKGEILGQIDVERLKAQREELQAKLAGLKVAARRADARKSQIKESYQATKLNLARFQHLYAGNAVPKKNLDDLATQERSSRIELNATDLSYDEIAVQRKQLAANERLLELAIRDTRITAPMTGTILKKFVEEGELVNPGMPICRMADLQDLWVKVYLSEKSLNSIKLNDTLKVLAGGKTHDGKVVWISPKAEFTPKQVMTREVNATLVYAVKVALKNPEGTLRIGMPVEVSLK